MDRIPANLIAMNSSERLGVAAAILATSLVGSAVAASSLIVGYPVLSGQALRYGLGAIALVLVQRWRGRRLPRLSPREAGLVMALTATGLVGFNLCLLGAIGRADPAVVGVVVGCVPVLLGLAGPLLARRAPRPAMLAAAVVVVAGTALAQGGGRAGPAGLALAGGALLGEAAFSLLAVPLLPRLGPLALSAYTTGAASAVLAAGAVGLEGRHALRLPTAPEAAALAWLAVATPLAFVTWYWSVGRLGVERAGLFAGVIPVASLLCVALVGTSTVTPLKLAGSVLVGAGIVVGLRRGDRARRVASGAGRGGPTAARRLD
jgi:drug/metabolite transporter (DMT)-like permease